MLGFSNLGLVSSKKLYVVDNFYYSDPIDTYCTANQSIEILSLFKNVVLRKILYLYCVVSRRNK